VTDKIREALVSAAREWLAEHGERACSESLALDDKPVELPVRRGNTGREFRADDEAYSEVLQWAKRESRDELLAHPTARRFVHALKSMAMSEDGLLRCVRGRLDDGEIKDWRDMGPNPEAPGSRYNSAGIRTLYACDREIGVYRELRPKPGTRLLLQEYVVPLDVLRIAECRSDTLPELAKCVFDAAEHCGMEGGGGLPDYLFGQVVGGLVREAGYDGMIVPDVQGDLDIQYSNVVVFMEFEEWREWSLRGAGFRCVRVEDEPAKPVGDV